jgi:endogenous inhibitor of DNA gyrase (YacG/DUF329 family)
MRCTWTAMDDMLFESYYQTMTQAELAAFLGKPAKSVDARLASHFPHLKKKNPRVSLVCAQCGAAFTRCVSLATAKNPFCSVRCKAVWQSENLRGKQNPGRRPMAVHLRPYDATDWRDSVAAC